MSNDRTEQGTAFLKAAGWGDAAREDLPGDASSRRYSRLRRGGNIALLMDAPPAAETGACPPGASPQTRRALGYNAEARLAGPDLAAFIDMARALRETGIAAPEIFAADEALGFALIEDFGDNLFRQRIDEDDTVELPLYLAATDVLSHLHREATAFRALHDRLQDYDMTAMMAEIRLLSEWYLPFRDRSAEDSALQDWNSAWEAVLQNLSPPAVPVLRDYHAENLLWRPGEPGLARVGVIDFQDGLVGHAAYDLVSLIEDARRDVSTKTGEAVLKHYLKENETRPGFDTAQFMTDFAILAAQRNAKILGIFARLVRRDGKPRYESLLPRVEAHFRQDLQRPALEPVRHWASHYMPELVS